MHRCRTFVTEVGGGGPEWVHTIATTTAMTTGIAAALRISDVWPVVYGVPVH